MFWLHILTLKPVGTLAYKLQIESSAVITLENSTRVDFSTINEVGFTSTNKVDSKINKVDCDLPFSRYLDECETL